MVVHKFSRSLVSLVSLLLCLTSLAFAGVNKVLTDVTFEHDTQAATGQTTGVWLVRFCDRKAMSNWCVDGFIEYWADLCDDLLQEHGILTGTVDLSKNAKLAKRFSSPVLDEYGVQLVLFKDHGMYVSSVELPGDKDMTKEQVKDWVLGGHMNDAKQAVPPEPTFIDVLREKFDAFDVQNSSRVAGIVAAVAVAVAGWLLKTALANKATRKRAAKED